MKIKLIASLLLFVLIIVWIVLFYLQVDEVEKQNLALLKTTITVPTIKNKNLIWAIRNIRAKSPVPIYLEIFRRRDQDNEILRPTFEIPAGTYTIEELLARFKKDFSGISWLSDTSSINLQIKLDDTIEDPFLKKVGKEAQLNVSYNDFQAWFLMNCPNFGLGFADHGLSLDPTKVILDIRRDMTIRELLNSFAKKSNTYWFATVHNPQYHDPDEIKKARKKGIFIIGPVRGEITFFPRSGKK